jgi:hypothetical protein
MSDNNPAANFGKFVPGFDFLQGLATQAVKGAAQGIPQLPNPANWVAPTLSVEELDKRIQELKTVQFWLDQNAKALQATITALEVQKMTLATLKGMNFNMGDVANAFKLKAADSVASTVSSALDKAGIKPAAKKKSAAKKGAPSAAAFKTTGLVDPMQWWGSLTQQFGQIATNAMKDAGKQTALDTTRNMAKAMTQTAVNTALNTAKTAAKTAASTASKTASRVQNATQNATKSIASRADSMPGIASKSTKKSTSRQSTGARASRRR